MTQTYVYIFDVIEGRKDVQNFMKACDLIDTATEIRGKEYTIEITSGHEPTEEYVQQLIEHLQSHLPILRANLNRVDIAVPLVKRL